MTVLEEMALVVEERDTDWAALVAGHTTTEAVDATEWGRRGGTFHKSTGTGTEFFKK
ncbi:multiple cyclophane-containing RiPP AmcA [Amycolatopsis dendrobii]|uniref:Uncharacterized protein n=1 Tax=Amycolatopsis dendrobii TaxID=2760662 RepID=A0A7W3ZAC3_9PSEU|nr:multiple cyclophane-containing RiPP AmcA [Amycolatopsis dendrobii]MBB1153538.1 hypothetical protein [Amycolatopsis dendrobii]